MIFKFVTGTRKQLSCAIGRKLILQFVDNVWKIRGDIMVNGVHREVPKQKLEVLQAARILALGLLEGLHSP